MTSGDGPFRTPSAPAVAASGATTSIGALRTRYGADWQRHERWLIALLPIVLAIAGAAHGWRVTLVTTSIGLVAGLASVLFRRGDRGRVDLHEDGIALVDADGGSREIAFDDIDLLFVSLRRTVIGELPIGNHIVVTTHDGARLVLPGSRYLAPLVEVLVRRCSMPLVAPARAALANDETLVFGALTISRTVLSIAGRERPWCEIGRVTFGLDRLSVYDHRGRFWEELTLATVPHTQALATLIGELTRVEHVRPRIHTLFARSD